jgi:hypothetical protein
MPFRPRRARLRALILASMLLAAGGCALIRPIGTPPTVFSCAALIPDSDRQPVAPTALPPPDVAAGALWIALDQQTARLDMANGHTADVAAIMDRCEAERAKALAPPKALWPLRLP